MRGRALAMALLAGGMMGTSDRLTGYRPQSVFNATLPRKEWKRRKRRLEMTKHSRKQNRR
jgi:hypothetical protein